MMRMNSPKFRTTANDHHYSDLYFGLLGDFLEYSYEAGDPMSDDVYKAYRKDFNKAIIFPSNKQWACPYHDKEILKKIVAKGNTSMGDTNVPTLKDEYDIKYCPPLWN